MQRRNVCVKTAFRFQLQEAIDIAFGKVRHFDTRRQSPFQRQAYDAIAFLHARRIEMIANFLSDKLGRRSERVQRQRNRKGLLNLQRTISSPKHNTVQFAAVERESEKTCELAAFERVNVE